MVAIVGGNALGLGLGSMATLVGHSSRGVWGNAAQGRSGEGAFVNAATGNLVLQGRDDLLAARGLDVASTRTYNSQGLLDDDNGDNWSLGLSQRAVRLAGPRNTAGSTVTRVGRDGAEGTYAWDESRARYVGTDGDGAFDTIVYETATLQWIWTDGDSGREERYDPRSTGQLVSSRDVGGHTITYAYTGNGAGGILLTSATSSSGETVHYDYAGRQLTQVRTVFQDGASSTTLTRVRYAYDAENRLASVTVDLSPGDNSIADGRTYITTYTYDGTSRRVASALQSDGTGLRFTHVQVGGEWRIATIRDALDQATSFAYDTANRRTTVTSPLGFATVYTYDAAGQLVQVAAPGQSTAFAWDASGNLVRTTDGAGRTVDMAYDANGNQTLVRDAAGNTVVRTFSATNLLLTETTFAVADPDGSGAGQPAEPITTRQVWDAAGQRQLRFVLTADGRVVESRYDGNGDRVSTITHAGALFDVGGFTSTQVPTEAEVAAWAAAQDKTRTERTDQTYDARGLLQSATTYATVDANGQGVADGGRSVTRFVRDQAGLLLQAIAPAGGITESTYDGLGRVLTVKDALGRITTTQYQDAAGKTAVTLASGLVTTSAWDAAGRLVSVVDGTASVTRLGETKWFHDVDGRLRMTQDPTGVRAWLLYDDAGRRVADVDGDGTLTEYAYDGSDRLTRTIVHANRVDLAALVDAVGRPLPIGLAAIRPAASAADRTSWRAYDAAGRLSATVDASGAVVASFYDGASRLVTQVAYANRIATGSLGADPSPAAIAPAANAGADRTTRWFHDAGGRVIGVLDAEGFLVESRHDAAGRLSTTTRYAIATAPAARATSALTALRPTAHPDDQTTTLLYNNKGQVAGIVDAERRLTEKIYDADGNLARVIRYATPLLATPAASSTVGDVRPSSNAEDQVTAWAYDTLDRPTEETNADGTVTRFAYETAGRLVTTTKAYGLVEARASNARYDVQGRLVGELSGEGGALLTGNQTQAEIDTVWLLHGIAHTVDAAGRRTSTTDQTGNRTLFFYDAADRLTHTVNALGEVEERTYDAFGQLASTTRLGTRIAPAVLGGLAGGLATAALTDALAAVRNAGLDSTSRFTYASTGALVASSDALGNVTTRALNAFGEVVATTVPLGGATTRTDTRVLDRRGQELASTADAGGVVALVRADYDAFGRLVRSVDANGNVRRQSFDKVGRVVSTVDAAGGVRSTAYDAFDRVLRQTDALGKTTTTAYSTGGRSVTLTTPEGVSVTTTRNRHGETATVRDGRGSVTTYRYDRSGHLALTSEPLGRTSTLTSDRAGRVIETSDARGIRTTFAYDAAGRVLQRTVDPGGLALTTSYAFDAKGQRTSVTDANGTVTTTAYDLRGQTLREVVDPGGLALETRWSWDAQGHVLSVEKPLGSDGAVAVTRYTYDALGRRVGEVVDPDGLRITRAWTYDTNGNAVTARDGNGGLSRFVYDGSDRLVWQVDAAGGVIHTVHDAEGRALRVTTHAVAIDLTGLPDAVGAVQVAERVVATPGKDRVESMRYDADGRLRFTVDGTGAVVQQRFDGSGNVVERIAFANRIDLAGWDGSSDPAVVSDPAHDRRSRFVYDALDRLWLAADGLGAVTGHVYDGNGNETLRVRYAAPVAAIDPVEAVRGGAGDRVDVYAYDAANREVGHVDATGAVTRTDRDRMGNAVRTTQHARTVAVGGAPGSAVADAADRVTRREFDRAGRLSWAADALGYVTGFGYDAEGRTTATTRFALAVAANIAPSGVSRSPASDRVDRNEFDRAGRLVAHVDALGGVERFTLDGLGHKTSFTNQKGSVWRYAYDAAGRLREETSPEVETTTVRGKDVLVEAGTTTGAIVTRLGYDALGNLTGRTEAAGRPEERTTRYGYDAVGHQVRVVYPTVSVYVGENAAQLAANGATGRAGWSETLVALSTSTVYDAFGDAVANVDVAGASSAKTYDAAGRVVFEVDALGHVTGYGRNAFGDAIEVHRYGTATALVGLTESGTPTVPTTEDVRGTVEAAAFDRSTDRVLRTVYDALGRAVQVTEPQSFTWSLAAGAGLSGKKTVNAFDAFGDLVSVAQSSSASTWVTTYRYHDKAGNETAIVDALGYRTQKDYDSVGNLVGTTEFATALAAGSWSATNSGSAVSSAKDRRVVSSYDRANRKVAETRVGVAYSAASDGTSTNGNLTTSYGYDAVGNLTRTTDALGASVFSFYDALGRVTAVTAPTRTNAIDVKVLTPITLFRRDAHGNVVVKTERATGASAAVEFTGVSTAGTPGFAAGAASAADRHTVTAFDASSRVLASTDATGASRFFSYDPRGQLAKTWQTVAGNDGTETTLFEAYRYDRLGRLTHTLAPAPSGALPVIDRSSDYNAFGEVTHRRVDGVHDEYFDYDGAGHLWRTNQGDGVAKVYLYDLLGRQTSQITSAGGDLKLLAGADQANALADARRTDTRYDDLGHVVQRLQPQRLDKQGGVHVVRQLVTAGVGASMSFIQDESSWSWTGTNRVDLSWSSLAGLGAGDVRVDVSYTTAPVGSRRGVAATRSSLYAADAAASSVSMAWSEDPQSVDAGVSAINRVRVSKKDLAGTWRLVVDRTAFGFAGNTIEVAAPADRSTLTTLELRPAGSNGGYGQVTLVDFGEGLRFDASALALGSYEYRVQTTVSGRSQFVSSSGTVTLSEPPLSAIGIAIGYGGAGAGVLAWQRQSGLVQELRYRASGSTGAWTQLAVGNRNSGYDGADTSALGAGRYDFELLWTRAGETSPFAHAVGGFTVTAAIAPVNVPAVGYPPVSGIGMVSGSLTWTAVPADATFRFRAGPTASWQTLPVTTDESSVASVDISGLGVASYEFEIIYRAGSTTVAYGRGTLVVNPQGAGHYETRMGTVRVLVTVTPPSPAPYQTGWSRAVYGAPIVIGHDESLNPILADHYAWSGNVVVGVPYTTTGIVRYDTVQEPIYGNVTVNPPDPANYIDSWRRAEYRAPVVVGQDENGVPILGAHYAWSGSVVVGVPYTERQIVRYDTVTERVRVIIDYDYRDRPIWGYVNQTRQVPVYGDVTVNPPNPANYMTRAPRPVYRSPVVVGVDGYGNQILSARYRWQGDVAVGVPYQQQQIVGYRPVQKPVYGPVTVTPPDPSPSMTRAPRATYAAPVFAGYDGNGEPILGAHYAWSGNVVVGVAYQEYQNQQQPQQVWIPGATPPPTATVTTPPFTAAYTIPGTPKAYTASVATPASSTPISLPTQTAAAAITQSVAQADDTRWLRPTVEQLVDRWGNVLEMSDPRNTAWKTRFEYDGENRVVLVMQPNVVGNLDGSSPVTRQFYDALGRMVATRNARGNVSGTRYDAGGNVVQELHADGGIVTHGYDVFGDRRTMLDALGRSTSYTYDNASRLVATRHAAAAAYSVSGSGMTLSAATWQQSGERSEYDAAGRKLSQTDSGGRVTRYRYDRAGNLVATSKGSLLVSSSTFDTLGRKLSETDGNSLANRWEYDDWRLKRHTDLGAHVYSYAYDNAGQLTSRQTTGQTITYGFDAAGQLTRIVDDQSGRIKSTSYAYDLAGQRVREQTVQQGIVYQDNRLAYDTLGRLRLVDDGRAHVEIDYDAVGNRSHIQTRVNLATPGSGAADDIRDSHRWFLYDQMERQIVVDGVDAQGHIGPTQGRIVTYDNAGNRTSDQWYGNAVQTSGGETVVVGYDDESGQAIYDQMPHTYARRSNVLTKEVYRYDALNRLSSVDRDGVQVDQRLYALSGEVVQSGPNGSLPRGYAEALNEGVAQGSTIGLETRRSLYDASGRLQQQRTLKVNDAGVNTARSDILYAYDKAGNLGSYALRNYDGKNYTNTFRSGYEGGRFDGYSETSVDATSTEPQMFKPGRTAKQYDLNGHLLSVDDTTRDSNDKTFVNDASGIALEVTQAGNVERQLVVNGEVLGRYGMGIDPTKPRAESGGNAGEPLFARGADFDFGYEPITGSYPAASVGSYQVRSGDTLRSIARSAYGDSALWYRLAEANGLSNDRDLRVGQTLNVPSGVGTVSNSADTGKPYDPSKIVGDTTPNMPVPSADKGCGGLAMILVIVVAVVVTIYTAGAAAGAWGAVGTGAAGTTTGVTAATATATGGTFSTGLAALGGGYGATGFAAAAPGAAAGSVASQALGVAIGTQEKFSWSAVALSAISAGVTAGLGSYAGAATLTGSGLNNVALRAAVVNAATQGIGVATGLQSSFNWKGVAASAAGAAVGSAVGDALQSSGTLDGLGKHAAIAIRTMSGIAGGLTAASTRGGRVAVSQVAIDAFGNALGQGIVDAATPAPESNYSLAGSHAKFSEEVSSVRLGTGDAGSGLVVPDARIASNDGMPPRPGMRYTDAGWQDLDGTTPAVGDMLADASSARGAQGRALGEVTRVNAGGQIFYKWLDDNGSTQYTEYDPRPQTVRDPVPRSNHAEVMRRVAAGAAKEGELRLGLDAQEATDRAEMDKRQDFYGGLRGFNQAGVDAVWALPNLYKSVRDYGFVGTGEMMLGGLAQLPGQLGDAARSGDVQTLTATGAGLLIGPKGLRSVGGEGLRIAEQSAVRLGNRALPEIELPWVSYQKHVTGRSYEEIWQLGGQKIALDARRAGYTVEAKWAGRNDAAWDSSIYNPSHRFYNEEKILGQASRQLDLNTATGGSGVRFAVSNEAAQGHFSNLFQAHFPNEMSHGELRVWYVPGNGMRR